MTINTLKKMLLYKNIKILILITYPIFGFLLYVNWDYIASKWLNGLNLLQKEPDGIIVSFLIIYYCFFTLYIIFIPMFPLTIFDKKYGPKESISLELFKADKKNGLKILKYLLLYLGFPLVSIFAVFIWLVLDVTFYAIGYILGIIMIISIAFLMFQNIFKGIINVFRKLIGKS